MNDNNKFIRIWKELDIKEVHKHLLLVDDLYATCGNCKQLGLNYLKDKTCKNCGTVFKYIATSLKNQSEIAKILQRIRTEKLDLIMVEKEDFTKASAKDAANDLFKKP